MFSMDRRGTTKSKKQLRLSTKRKKRRLPLALLAAKSQSKELTTPTPTEPVVEINPSTSQVMPVSMATSFNEFIPQLTSTPNVAGKKTSIRKRMRTVSPHLMKWRLTKKKSSVDKTLDFLAASPDGVVGEQDIIEVKCPKSAELLTIPEAVKQIKSFCLAPDKSSKEIKLKRNHNYYYQVQGQLHIANKRNCFFVVWTKKDIHIEAIERDDRFWTEKMEKALCYFYNCALLPELVDPRTCRSMPIREPQIPLA